MVAEWLAGRNKRPLKRERGIAIGDMPVFGAGSAANSGQSAGSSGRGIASQNLQLLEMERERARERRETQDRERKAGLEGEKAPRAANAGAALRRFRSARRPSRPIDRRRANASAKPDRRARRLRPGRSAGPIRRPRIPRRSARVFKRSLQLPAASTSMFALSSVIVADQVSLREVPVSAAQQTSHPYSIGATEIVPARDQTLTNDERLALVVQVINARATPDGKPDVAVGFRIQRRTPNGHEQVGVLSPQSYNRPRCRRTSTATRASRSSRRWGCRSGPSSGASIASKCWRRIAWRASMRSPARTSRSSARRRRCCATLRRSRAAFKREDALRPLAPRGDHQPLETHRAVVCHDGGARCCRSAALRRSGAGRRGDAAGTRREGAAPRPGRCMRSATRRPPWPCRCARRPRYRRRRPPLQVLTGATRALEGSDRDAITAWQAAMDAGLDAPAVAPLLIDANLRLGDTRARDRARAAPASNVSRATPPWCASSRQRACCAIEWTKPYEGSTSSCGNRRRCRCAVAAAAGPLHHGREGCGARRRASSTRAVSRSWPAATFRPAGRMPRSATEWAASLK